DFSAVAVLEQPLVPPATSVAARRPGYHVRYLARFPVGTPYPAVAGAVRALVSTPPLPGCALVVDQTGVGRAVVDLLAEALGDEAPCHLWPVTITGGRAVTAGPAGGLHVPKRELVGTLQVLLQGRRLQLARGLPEARALVRELEGFGVAVTAARHEVFG